MAYKIHMTQKMQEIYEKYKDSGNYLLDYDELLLFCPDYYKIKIMIENEKFTPKEEVDLYFEKNYQDSELYKKLKKLAMAEDEIYDAMKSSKDFRYLLYKCAFMKYQKSIVQLCELIDYIGHYPERWPVPKEEEKNLDMELLLEEYDIIVSYHASDDIDLMQITSDDVVRIIEKLKDNLTIFEALKKGITTNDWSIKRVISDRELEDRINTCIREMEDFPQSNYQKKGRSRRKEVKRDLRRQHGNKII